MGQSSNQNSLEIRVTVNPKSLLHSPQQPSEDGGRRMSKGAAAFRQTGEREAAGLGPQGGQLSELGSRWSVPSVYLTDELDLRE